MTAPPIDNSDHLRESSFRAIAEMIEARVGIKMPPTKQTMVEGRLRKRVRALNLESFDDYANYIFERGHLEQEIPDLIDCVTTNKTDFFREPAHFDFLRDVAVPQLLKARGVRAVNLKIWSSACSSGAEVYTLAMVLQDMLTSRSDFRYFILGTDISRDVLREAKSAIYPIEFVAAVPQALRKRYVMFARETKRGVARIAPEIRARTRFERLNLMDPSYPVDTDVDIIFCRNVLIYFDKPTQHAVVGRLVSHLRPGGFLILGHSESMAAAGTNGITQIMPTVFMASTSTARRSVA
jgi:chemotaxis protein methyltransferase CheR